jgi:tetratricopeptide (TPR) repeat protein
VSEKERFTIQGQYFSQSEKTFQRAIQAYQNLLDLYPQDEVGNNNLGYIYACLEEWDKAVERFAVNKRMKSDSIQLYTNLSAAYARSGQQKKAHETLRFFIENISNNVVVHFQLVRYYLALGKIDLAKTEAEKIFSLDPSHYLNYVVRGDIALFSWELDKAEAEYVKLLDTQEPSAHHTGFMRSGLLNLLRGKYSVSEEYFEQGIELSDMLGEMSQKAWYYANLAYLYMRAEDYKRALEMCESGWKSAAKKEDLEFQRRILHIKGMILTAQGLLGEAQRTVQDLRALIDSGMNKKAIRYVHHLEGQIEAAKGNYHQAARKFQEAVSLLPAVFEAQDWFSLFVYSLASAYEKAGNFDKARSQFEKIIPSTWGRLFCGDVYAKTFFKLGRIHQGQGDLGNAEQNYERFLLLVEDSDLEFLEVAEAKSALDSIKKQ